MKKGMPTLLSAFLPLNYENKNMNKETNSLLLISDRLLEPPPSQNLSISTEPRSWFVE